MMTDWIPTDFALDKGAIASAIWTPDPRINEPACVLQEGDPAPAEYLGRLVEHELYLDAVHFVARALPRREAVYWACVCWGCLHGPGKATPDEDAAFEAAMRWVREPSESTRRAAEDAGRTATMHTAGGCAAMAAFWSGGSMAPLGARDVEPPADLTGKAAAASVILCAAVGEYKMIHPNKRRFVEWAMPIATGELRWIDPAADKSVHESVAPTEETIAGIAETLIDRPVDELAGAEELAARS